MSDRGLTAESKTYLAGADAVVYNLLKMDFVSPLFFTDAPFDITHGGDIYSSNGTVVKFPDISETTDIKPNTMTIDFSGVELSAHALTTSNYKNVEVTIYKKIMSATTQVLKVYLGYIDTYSSSENIRKGSADIKWRVVNHWYSLAKTIGRLLNDEYQQDLFAGDDGLEFIGVTDSATDWWGKRSYVKTVASLQKPEAVKGATTTRHLGNTWLWHTKYDWYYDWDAASLSNERLPIAYGEVQISGVPVFRGLSGTNNEYLWVVYALCEGEVDSILSTTIDGEDVTGANLSANVFTSFHAGSDTQTVDAALAAAFAGYWTSTHTLSGICYQVVRYLYNSDLFEGEPSPVFTIKGKKLYDPRTTLTAYSRNNALVLLDYLSSEIYGNSIPIAIIDNVIASADICDQQKDDYSGGALIDRYSFNGIIDSNKKLSDNVDVIRFSMFADIPWINGLYVMRLEAETKTPTYSFDSTNIKGVVDVKNPSMASFGNKLIYKYTDASEGYISASVVEVSATYLAEDGGVVLEKTYSNAFETNIYRARNLAKTLLKKSRGQAAVTIEAANADSLIPIAGDVVTLSLESKQWVDKEFIIKERKITEFGEDKFSLSEYNVTDYDWSIGTLVPSISAPPLSSPFFVAPPALLTLDSGSAQLLIGDDGTIMSRIFGDFVKATDAYVDRYEVHAKKSTETNYILRETILAKDNSEFFISPVEDGITYNVRMYAVNSLGKRSAAVDVNHLVVGKDQLPVAPISIGIGSVDENVVNLFWGTSPDKDFAAMEVWVSATNDRALAILIVTQPGTTFNHSTSIPMYYWVRAVDTSDLKSTYFPVSTTGGLLGTPNGITTVAEWDDILDGAGTKPDDNATVGAIWSSNITGQPADADLLNSLQDWLDVSGDGIPDSYFERGIVIHNWFNTNHTWITSQNNTFSTGLVMTASTTQGSLASMQFLLTAKWTWDAGRFFSVSFSVTGTANHSTTLYSYLGVGGLGTTMNLSIAFRKVGSVMQAYGYKNIAGVSTFTLIIGGTFTDGDNIRAEAYIDPANAFTTVYRIYVNGILFGNSNTIATKLNGSSAASTVPNFLTNVAVGGNFVITISDYYFQQLEA